MKNKKPLTALLLASALVSACSSAPQAPGSSVRTSARPQGYAAPAPRALTYGEWFIEPRSCTIRAHAAEFTLSTDGIPTSKGTLDVRALFIAPLVRPPVAEISEILVPLPIEGARRGYNLVLAYDAENAAHMLKPDTYLIVRYQPMVSNIALESSFSTRGLMQALADLSKYC
ncbi:MAG: hypothetical protein DI628_01070 [Blastochloris viridis]|uniref:Lipoprotein n=1 Tax=Blastochloris viridis TaxID=1079 RepID=A0A6N4R304_BLAVI|nr:MAG: hypothetical protein DI628_01070 [Blastochloris viridis]